MSQQPTMENPRQYDDEIDLRDLIIALWKGKWIIIISVLVAMLAAGAYLKLVPQTYKGQINIQPLAQVEMASYASFNRTGVLAIESAMLVNELQQELVKSQGMAEVINSPSDGKNGLISFTTKTPNKVNEAIQQILPAANDNIAQSLSQRTTLALANLKAVKELELAQQETKLLDNIALAQAANIAIGTQQINVETPMYVRGYKVLETMLQQLRSKKLVSNNTEQAIQQAPFTQPNFIAAHVPATAISMQPKIKPMLLLALSFILGGMLGVMILVLRNVLRTK